MCGIFVVFVVLFGICCNQCYDFCVFGFGDWVYLIDWCVVYELVVVGFGWIHFVVFVLEVWVDDFVVYGKNRDVCYCVLSFIDMVFTVGAIYGRRIV